MKKIYFLFIGILSFSCLYAQGFNSSFAVIDANGSVGDYCMYSNTSCGANGSLDGQNFGSFTEGSSALTLRGVKFNLYKCSGQDINTPTLYYRVYPSGSPSGSFSSFTSGITSYPANGCGGEDQTWNDISKNVNLLTGLQDLCLVCIYFQAKKNLSANSANSAGCCSPLLLAWRLRLEPCQWCGYDAL